MAKLNLHDKTINMMCEISAARDSGDDKRLMKSVKKGCKLANEIVKAHNEADHHFKALMLGVLHKSLMGRLQEVAEINF